MAWKDLARDIHNVCIFFRKQAVRYNHFTGSHGAYLFCLILGFLTELRVLWGQASSGPAAESPSQVDIVDPLPYSCKNVKKKKETVTVSCGKLL